MVLYVLVKLFLDSLFKSDHKNLVLEGYNLHRSIQSPSQSSIESESFLSGFEDIVSDVLF